MRPDVERAQRGPGKDTAAIRAQGRRRRGKHRQSWTAGTLPLEFAYAHCSPPALSFGAVGSEGCSLHGLAEDPPSSAPRFLLATSGRRRPIGPLSCPSFEGAALLALAALTTVAAPLRPPPERLHSPPPLTLRGLSWSLHGVRTAVSPEVHTHRLPPGGYMTHQCLPTPRPPSSPAPS